MKSYFAYVRVSTARQGENGTSPQEQRHAITGYALRNNLEIAEWYQESESAAKAGRPAFTALVRDLRRRRVAGVVMHKIDRGARNLRDWAVLLDLVDEGIELHFAHETVDLTSRGGRLTANIQAVMAADYSRNLSDEVKKGQLGRLRQGLYPLRAPRGYLDQGKAKPKIIDPVQGPLVREAFERYASGSYSIDTLRRYMAARGLSNRGAPISRNVFNRLLRNPFYMGLIRFGTHAELFAGSHEPIVSRELFERVGAMLSGKSGGKVQKHDFLFRRMLHCAACGCTITGERQKGRVYYRCPKQACRGTSAREDVIDEVARHKLDELRLPDREIGDFRDVLRALQKGEHGAEERRRASIQLELAKLDTRTNRLTELLLDGTIDRAAYVAKKEELLLERQTLLEAQAATSSYWAALGEKFELGFVAYLSYEKGNAQDRRDILNRISSNFTLSRKEPAITLKFPFAEWAEWAKSNKCGVANAEVRTRAQIVAFLEGLQEPESYRQERTAGVDPATDPDRPSG